MIAPSYRYKAKIVRILDADTLEMDVDLGFYVTVRHRIRLLGVNAPELNSKDTAERLRALDARKFVQSILIMYGSDVTIESRKSDSFGRFLAHVFVSSGEDLSEMLLRNGHAIKYKGK